MGSASAPSKKKQGDGGGHDLNACDRLHYVNAKTITANKAGQKSTIQQLLQITSSLTVFQDASKTGNVIETWVLIPVLERPEYCSDATII